MRPIVFTSNKMISEIILSNYKMFDNKLLEEFLQLCKASVVSIRDELELEKSHPVVQKFFTLVSMGLDIDARLKRSITIHEFIKQVGDSTTSPYIFDDEENDAIPKSFFKTGLASFESEFSKISASTIADHTLLAIADLDAEDDPRAAPFLQISHNTSRVFIYDRYIFRSGKDGNRIRSLQSTVLPILRNLISDLRYVEEIVIVGSDMHLAPTQAKCSEADLERVSKYVNGQLRNRGFKGKLTCAVVTKKMHNEHGRWIITDYLKLKSDDSWSFLGNREMIGVGNDISVFPNYKPKHNKQVVKLLSLIEAILSDPKTIQFTT